MSPSSPSSNEHQPLAERGVVPDLDRYGTGLKSGVSSVAFWTAIVLPFLHLPLLATGLDRAPYTTAFAALVVLNVVAVVLGQPHNRE